MGIIKDRRNVAPENFTDRVIHKEIIQNLLNAAIWAPTHGKTQPWRFEVFMNQGKEELKTIMSAAYKELTPEDKFQEAKYKRIQERIDRSSALIMVNMSRQEEEKIPEIEEIQATAIAIQNINLLATAYGIASFWSSPAFIYTKEFKKRVSLSEKDHCLGLLYLGYVNPSDWPKGQRKPIEYLTNWHE